MMEARDGEDERVPDLRREMWHLDAWSAGANLRRLVCRETSKQHKPARRISEVAALSTNVIVRILDFVFALPKPETVHCWPVHVRPCDGRFAVHDCQFDAKSRGRLTGYWTEDEHGLPSLLCIEAVTLSDPTSAFGVLDANRICWFQPTLDDEAQLACWSTTRDTVRAIAHGGCLDWEHAFQVDPIGIDYGPCGRRFTYQPSHSRINRSLAAHYCLAINVKHNVPDFVRSRPAFGYWLTAKPRTDLLAVSRDDEEMILADVGASDSHPCRRTPCDSPTRCTPCIRDDTTAHSPTANATRVVRCTS